MIRIATILALVGLLTGTSVQAQDQTNRTSTARSTPSPTALIPEDQLVLKQYVPKGIDPRELSSVGMRIYGRSFFVGKDRGTARGPIKNILSLGNAVVVYDTPDRVITILKGLPLLWPPLPRHSRA